MKFISILFLTLFNFLILSSCRLSKKYEQVERIVYIQENSKSFVSFPPDVNRKSKWIPFKKIYISQSLIEKINDLNDISVFVPSQMKWVIPIDKVQCLALTDGGNVMLKWNYVKINGGIEFKENTGVFSSKEIWSDINNLIRFREPKGSKP